MLYTYKNEWKHHDNKRKRKYYWNSIQYFITG
jgi:hypothetical protein